MANAFVYWRLDSWTNFLRWSYLIAIKTFQKYFMVGEIIIEAEVIQYRETPTSVC